MSMGKMSIYIRDASESDINMVIDVLTKNGYDREHIDGVREQLRNKFKFEWPYLTVNLCNNNIVGKKPAAVRSEEVLSVNEFMEFMNIKRLPEPGEYFEMRRNHNNKWVNCFFVGYGRSGGSIIEIFDDDLFLLSIEHIDTFKSYDIRNVQTAEEYKNHKQNEIKGKDLFYNLNPNGNWVDLSKDRKEHYIKVASKYELKEE